jgi:type II secretory pathway component PulL
MKIEGAIWVLAAILVCAILVIGVLGLLSQLWHIFT